MNRTARIVLAASLLLLAVTGCRRGGSYIWVQQDRYIPNLPAELRAYSGQPIFLTTFINAAANTDRDYYYYSPDGAVVYEGSPNLSGYLRDVFAKGMTALGMQVVLDPPQPLDPRVAELQLAIRSWDDYALHFQIVLNKRQATVYQQEYRVEVPRIQTDDARILEDRAYRIDDMALGGMLADQGFQAAFFQ